MKVGNSEIAAEHNAPVHLDTDARNRRLSEHLLSLGLWVEPQFDETGLLLSLKVSTSNPNQGHCQG